MMVNVIDFDSAEAKEDALATKLLTIFSIKLLKHSGERWKRVILITQKPEPAL